MRTTAFERATYTGITSNRMRMHPRLLAGLVMLVWLVASIVVLLVFRGVPARLRVYFAVLSLLGLVWGIGVLRARFAK